MRERRLTRLAPAVVACVAVVLSIAPGAAATSGTLVLAADTTLAGDHQGSIVIDADNITLNCGGHTVSGPGTAGVDWGIIVIGRSGVTVMNCNVTGFGVGIRMSNTSNTDIRENVVAGQGGNGVFATGTTNDSFRSNEFSGNGAHGVSSLFCQGGRFLGNVFSGNVRSGLALTRSTGALITENVANGNAWSGILLSAASDNVLRENKTAGNAESGISLLGATDGSGLDSNDNTVLENTATGNAWFGIDLAYFSAVISGMPDAAAFANTLNGNAATKNALSGIGVFGNSSSNVIQDNRARNNEDFDGLDDSTGSGNTWANNNFGATSGI